VKVLGGFSICRAGGEAQAVPAGAPGLLVARLALAEDLSCTRDELVADLYPNDSPEVARPRLRVLQSRARALFGTDAPIEADRSAIWLDERRTEVDLRRLRQLLRRIAQEDNPAGAIHAYIEPLLPSLVEPWVVNARRALNRRLIEFAMSCEGEDAIRTLTRARRLEPLSEDLVCRLLEVQIRQGDAVGALALVEEFRRTWQAEVGLPLATAIESLKNRAQTTA